jgi:hypothetical protein
LTLLIGYVINFGMVTSAKLSEYGLKGAKKRWGDIPLSARFWRLVEKKNPDECWPWKGTKHRYGGFRIWDRIELAHRVAFMLTFGSIPDGKCVCHTCDNGFCCNPKHLWIGTHLENMRDMTKKGRTKAPDNRGRRHPLKYSIEFVKSLRDDYYNRGWTAKELAQKHKITFQALRGLIYSKHYYHRIMEEG